MEDSNKLPLKRVELSLTKFNEVAIPHHLDLLRQHKANIIKHERGGRAAGVRAEQAHARRVAAQLRALLGQVAALRARVRDTDLAAFDACTRRSRDLTLAAIVDYLGVIESSCSVLAKTRAGSPTQRSADSSPLPIPRPPHESMGNEAGGVAYSATSTDSVGVLAQGPLDDELQAPLIQLQVNDHEVALREREAVLRGWSELQEEVRALHDAWRHVQDAARVQHDQVATMATSVEVAADNVEVARANLSVAERLKSSGLCMGGAVVGAMAGGPVGLAVGAKAGAAVALAGSLLGYLGGRLLRRRVGGLVPPALPHDKDQ